ncbi:unnamed protein product, partial [Rotaria socialis]
EHPNPENNHANDTNSRVAIKT